MKMQKNMCENTQKTYERHKTKVFITEGADDKSETVDMFLASANHEHYFSFNQLHFHFWVTLYAY